MVIGAAGDELVEVLFALQSDVNRGSRGSGALLEVSMGRSQAEENVSARSGNKPSRASSDSRDSVEGVLNLG